jgi:hypothetical protein
MLSKILIKVMVKTRVGLSRAWGARILEFKILPKRSKTPGRILNPKILRFIEDSKNLDPQDSENL